jgi:hypothetical protein
MLESPAKPQGQPMASCWNQSHGAAAWLSCMNDSATPYCNSHEKSEINSQTYWGNHGPRARGTNNHTKRTSGAAQLCCCSGGGGGGGRSGVRMVVRGRGGGGGLHRGDSKRLLRLIGNFILISIFKRFLSSR